MAPSRRILLVRVLPASVIVAGLLAAGVAATERQNRDAAQSGGAHLFAQVRQLIAARAVDSIPPDSLDVKAAAGLVGEIGDPYASLFSSTSMARFLRNNIGNAYGGLGISIEMQPAGIAVTGIVAVLATLGYPVAALLGGLGLGGLAFALAAQKTLENLFGAVSIGADHLFREGDTVTIDGVTGTVEAIGLRSTRIRTPERTLVSMPNGKIADARIESFAPRDRIRLACLLQLVYDTTAAQMRTVIAGVDQVLRSEPRVAPDTIAVFFLQLGASSPDVQVIASFQTTDMSEFQRIRQDVLLRFMDVVERAGTQFAFPTQTVHIASLPSGDADALRPRADGGSPPASSSSPVAQGS